MRFFARPKQVIEFNGSLRHPFKAALEFLRDIQARRREDFRHRAVVAEDVDDEGFPQVVADALVRKQVADVEKIARVLAVERRDKLARIEVGEADDLDFRKTEGCFDGLRDRRVFGS